jgi:hypothetical protein
MKITLSWDVIMYSLVDVYQSFGRIFYLHCQDRRVRLAENKGLDTRKGGPRLELRASQWERCKLGGIILYIIYTICIHFIY